MALKRAHLDLNHSEGDYTYSVMQLLSTIVSFAGLVLGQCGLANPRILTMHLQFGYLTALSEVRQHYQGCVRTNLWSF